MGELCIDCFLNALVYLRFFALEQIEDEEMNWGSEYGVNVRMKIKASLSLFPYKQKQTLALHSTLALLPSYHLAILPGYTAYLLSCILFFFFFFMIFLICGMMPYSISKG